jgi:hypothetical protein
MGGGRGKLIRISTAAIIGMGMAITNANNIVPKSSFFILLPLLTFSDAICVRK